jgi:hypothetical protein
MEDGRPGASTRERARARATPPIGGFKTVPCRPINLVCPLFALASSFCSPA